VGDRQELKYPGCAGNGVSAEAGEMVARFQKEIMKKKAQKKLVQEGDFVAEVPVELIETDDGWSPYLSVEDAQKLDDVRKALRREDLKTAAKFGRIYRLTPVT